MSIDTMTGKNNKEFFGGIVREIEKDEVTGLALTVDGRDPPRYYLSSKKRIDLLSIGDVKLARASFCRKVEETQSRARKTSPAN